MPNSFFAQRKCPRKLGCGKVLSFHQGRVLHQPGKVWWVQTTKGVNHRLELKVTEELLWEQRGCAREKSQKEQIQCDHPFPLLAADTLHRNGALSEQDGPFYQAKICPFVSLRAWQSGGCFVWGGLSVCGATGIFGCSKQSKAESCLLAQMASPWPGEAGFGAPTFWGSAPRALPEDFWEAGAAYQTLGPSSGAFLDYWAEHLTEETINSFSLTWKQWLVPEAGQRPWKYQCF